MHEWHGSWHASFVHHAFMCSMSHSHMTWLTHISRAFICNITHSYVTWLVHTWLNPYVTEPIRDWTHTWQNPYVTEPILYDASRLILDQVGLFWEKRAVFVEFFWIYFLGSREVIFVGHFSEWDPYIWVLCLQTWVEWGMSHRNESCRIWMGHVTYEWDMSHMNESCHTCHVYMRHMWRGHVTYEWLMWMSHVTCEQVWSHMDESCVIRTCHVTYKSLI